LSGRKVFTAGEVLQAADVNDYLMDQSVMVFAGTAARGSAIPSPSEGMVTYRSDDDVVEVYNGASFVPVGPGQILQVVSTTKTDAFSVSIASDAFSSEVTGLQPSITPSSTSSKILVTGFVDASNSAQPFVSYRLTRNGTVISVGASASSRPQATGKSHGNAADVNGMIAMPINFLDSPSTSSSVTYGIELHNSSPSTDTFFVNRSGADSDGRLGARTTSTITLMEVAG
jgi:hypothetical protein